LEYHRRFYLAVVPTITIFLDRLVALWELNTINFLQGRREQELRAVPKWRKYWQALQKKETPEKRQKLEWERKFLHRLMLKFIGILDTIPAEGEGKFWLRLSPKYLFPIQYLIFAFS